MDRYLINKKLIFLGLQLDSHVQLAENNDSPTKSLLQISYLVHRQVIRSSSLQYEFLQYVYPLLRNLQNLMKAIVISGSCVVKQLLEIYELLWKDLSTNIVHHDVLVIIVFRLLKLGYNECSQTQEFSQFYAVLMKLSNCLGVTMLNSFGYLKNDIISSSFYSEKLHNVANQIIKIASRFDFWTISIKGIVN